MGRAWVWWTGIGTVVAASIVASLIPSYRLGSELAAARKDGIWTTPEEIRKGLPEVRENENAAALVPNAVAIDTRYRNPRTDLNLQEVAQGHANAASQSQARQAFEKLGPLLEAWRAVSEKPRLDFHRRWEDGYRLLLPSLESVKKGAIELVAAARLGIEPKKNLLAAARLAALMRQEPIMNSQMVSTNVAELVLDAATPFGFAKEVEPALGPPMNVRWALSIELAAALSSIDDSRRNRNGMGGETPHFSVGAVTDNRTYMVVHQFRTLWNELGKDPINYDQAAKIVDLRFGEYITTVSNTSPTLASMISSGVDAGQFVRDAAALESERKRIREAKP